MEAASSLYLRDVNVRLRETKNLADLALAQVHGEGFFVALDPEANSLASLILHVGGNLRSRWTDFLTTDGEKPDRDRDSEFEPKATLTRDELLARWEDGWSTLFASLGDLTEEDLARTVTIRAEPHTVVAAINRTLMHISYHVGQIVFLAKHLAGRDWQTLSVPRGGTRELNERMFGTA